MKVEDPKVYWESVSGLPNYRDFLLPSRTIEEYEKEGRMQAAEIMKYTLSGVDKVVIDYGCGDGRVIRHLSKSAHVGLAIGLDISKELIEKARALSAELPRLCFFTAEQFMCENIADVVYSLMVIQHNEEKDREDIIKHIHKLLKPDGICVINFPKKGRYLGTDYTAVFEREEVESYSRFFSGCRVVEGNLVRYLKLSTIEANEYFLIGIK